MLNFIFSAILFVSPIQVDSPPDCSNTAKVTFVRGDRCFYVYYDGVFFGIIPTFI